MCQFIHSDAFPALRQLAGLKVTGRNPKKLPGLGGGEYVTVRLVELAAHYIDENKDKPFLLYISQFSVHDAITG